MSVLATKESSHILWANCKLFTNGLDGKRTKMHALQCGYKELKVFIWVKKGKNQPHPSSFSVI